MAFMMVGALSSRNWIMMGVMPYAAAFDAKVETSLCAPPIRRESMTIAIRIILDLESLSVSAGCASHSDTFHYPPARAAPRPVFHACVQTDTPGMPRRHT